MPVSYNSFVRLPRRSISKRTLRLRLIVIALLVIPLALIFLNHTTPAQAGSCAQDPNNLLLNGTMAPGPVTKYGVVSANWNAYVLSSNVPHFENAPNEGWDPNGSQYIWSDYGPFDAGIFQSVRNLTPGQTYHFWIVWGQSLQDIGGNNQRTNQIDRQIGVDLTGGTNPQAQTVQWTVPYLGKSGFNRIEWNLYFKATGSTATFFLRSINYLTTGRDKIFFDTACLFAAAGSATTTPWATATATTARTATPSATSTPRATSTPATCALKPVTTISVGAHPKGIAVDPATNRIFVGLADASSVAVVDANTLKLLATWPTDGLGKTNGVAFAQNKVFVTKRNNAKVSVIDAATGKFLQNIAVGNAPYGIAASGTRLWVANFNDGTLSLIDATANTRLNTVAVGTYPALIAPYNNRAYVTIFGTGVSDVNSSDTVLHAIATGAGTFGVATNPLTNRVYTSNRNTNVVSMIDAASDTVSATLPESATPYALALNPNTNRLFILLADSNDLRVRDGGTGSLVADIPVGVQGANGGDSIAVLNNYVYVANNSAGTVTVIADCASGNP